MRLKYLLFLFSLTGLIFYSSLESLGQCNDWERLLGYKDVSIRDMQRDRFGNLYAVGAFFGPNVKIGSVIIPAVGSYYSIFILKLDKNDNLIWVKSTGDGTAELIEIDQDGNIVVTGAFYATSINFDCINLVNSSFNRTADVFIAKFSPDGETLWATQSNGADDELPRGLEITASNNIIVTGFYISSAASFQGKALTIFGGFDSFVTSLNSQGTVQWALSVGGPEPTWYGEWAPDYLQAVTSDSEGNIIITGFFESPTLRIGNYSIPYNTISENFFLAKIDPQGNVLWAKGLNTTADCGGYGLITDSHNNIYVAGRFFGGNVAFGTITLPDRGEGDIFLAKYDANGNVLLAKNFGGERFDVGTKLTSDQAGNIFLGGYYYSYSFSMDTFTATKSTFHGDIFIATLDEELQTLCLKHTSGSGDNLIWSLKTDPLNNVLVAMANIMGGVTEFGNGLPNSSTAIPEMIVMLGDNDGFDTAPSTFPFDLDLGQDLAICPGEEVVLDPGIQCGATYLWSNGSTQRTLKVKQPGLYWIEVNLNGSIDRDSVSISFHQPQQPFSINLGEDKTICLSESVLFDVTQTSSAEYRWNDGSSAPTRLINSAGLYWVEVKGLCQIVYDSVRIEIAPSLSLDLGVDKRICSNESILLNATQPGFAEYHWNDGSSEPNKSINTAGLYWVEVKGICQTVYDSIRIAVHPLVFVNLGEDRVICNNEAVLFNTTQTSLAEYRWNDGSSEPIKSINTGGLYWVEVKGPCQTVYDSISIVVPPPLSIDLGDDRSICGTESILFNTTQTSSAQYRWSDGSSEPIKSINTAGLYWVEVKGICQTVYDSIRIAIHPLVFVNLGEDRVLCSNESVLFNTTQTGLAEYRWNDGSSEPTKLINSAGLYWVEVIGPCQTAYDSVSIAVPPALAFDLGVNRSICANENTLLIASTPGASSYEWQDGSSSSEFFVTQTGTYQVTVSNHCESMTDSVHITVVDLSALFIPNVVTPDGNNLNDTFLLPEELEGSHLSVFNRWGKSIFYSSDYHNTWPEKEYPTGTYYFVLAGGCLKDGIKGYVQLIKN